VTKVLVIHHDKSIRTRLESLARTEYEVAGGKDLAAGIKLMPKIRPGVIVVGQDGAKQEGIRLLRYMKQNVLKTPVVVVFSRGAGKMQPTTMKLGAKGFLEHPVNQEQLCQAITDAMAAQEKANAGPPPITAEEMQANLSILERDLNREMRCFAGKNQVYIQSMITGSRATRPRICLKCSLRAEFGLPRDVYYEFIRDRCAGDPDLCKAVQLYSGRSGA